RGPTVRREQDRGPVLEAEERLQDLLLGAGVDASEGVVEEKHGTLERQRARQGDALLLPTRERDPALADHGIEPRRELAQIGFEAGAPGDAVRVGLALIVVEAEVDVGANRVREEERLLGHDAESPPERTAGPLIGWDPADEDGALRRLVEARDQVEQGRLARAGPADDRDRLAGAQGEVDSA